MNTIIAPAIIMAALAYCGPTLPAMHPVSSNNGCTLYVDSNLGGQPQELWCGGRQYLYHRGGGGISESGFVAKIPGAPSLVWPTMTCSGDYFDNPNSADVYLSAGKVTAVCAEPRNWNANNEPQSVWGLDLEMRTITEAINGGWRVTLQVTNKGETETQFDAFDGHWGLFPQLHILRSALDPDRAWYLDAEHVWRQFPSLPDLSGYGWLDLFGSWAYPAGAGLGIDEGGLGIAVITPGRHNMPIKVMYDPAWDGSVPDLTLFGASAPLVTLLPGKTYAATSYVLAGSLQAIANATAALAAKGAL